MNTNQLRGSIGEAIGHVEVITETIDETIAKIIAKREAIKAEIRNFQTHACAPSEYQWENAS